MNTADNNLSCCDVHKLLIIMVFPFFTFFVVAETSIIKKNGFRSSSNWNNSVNPDFRIESAVFY
jgi:hypothetical protein